MSRVVLRLRSICLSLAIFATSALVLSGCTRHEEAGAKKDRVVSVAIWASYLSPEVQKRFTDETGIKLVISNYSSNEELLAKVQASGSGFDLAVPSDYMVEVMHKLDLLQPLAKAKIPNMAGIDEAVLKQSFDPENAYSLPFGWSTTGIAVNRELFKGQIKGWKDVFNNPALAGKISLLDDMREVMAIGLKYQGESVNTTDEAKLKKAQAALKELKPRIKMFKSDMIDALVNKEVAVAHAYSSDALQASRRTKGVIEYILPEEGGSRSIDNMVILKSAKNVEEAHALINFLLSKESNVDFVSKIMGGPVIKATRDGLPAEVKSIPALFPLPNALAKFEFIKDVGAATRVYDRLWTELKAQ